MLTSNQCAGQGGPGVALFDMQMTPQLRRHFVFDLIQIYESSPEEVDGELSNVELLTKLHELYATLPARPVRLLPVPSTPPPPYQSLPPDSGDESAGEDVIVDDYVEGDASDPEHSFAAGNDDDDDDDDDYFPPLDVHESDASSEGGMASDESNSEFESDSDSENGSHTIPKSEIMDLMLSRQSPDTDNVDTASVTAIAGQYEADDFDTHSEVFSDILINVSDFEEDSNIYKGLGNSPHAPINIE